MKRTKIILSILFWTAMTVSASAFFEPKDWQFYRNINTPPGAEFVKFVLPDTAAKDGNDFSDIRVITNEGIEVPYFLTKNATVRGGEVSGRILNQTVVNGETQFIVDTGKEGDVRTSIILDTDDQNYRRRVRIYSSSALLPLGDGSWKPVMNDGYIFKFTDVSSRFVSGKNDVAFSPNTSRYFKVVIDGGQEGPLRVSRATVRGDVSIDVPSYSKAVQVSVFNEPTKRVTDITLDLGERGHMTDAVTISTSDKNYSRRVVIESSDDAKGPWKVVGQGSISNISTNVFAGSSNKVAYPEQKTRYIRLSIVNDDNRPLQIDGTAKVEGPIVSAVFETRRGESYKLYYGNPSARTPTYDIARISSYIEENRLPAATLGPETENAGYIAPEPSRIPFTESNRWAFNALLAIIVIIAVFGIGWYLRSYIRKNPNGQW